MHDGMPARVDFCSPWDNPFVLDYNRYYLLGLDDVAHLTSSTAPWFLRPVRGMADKARIGRMLMQRVGARLGRRYPDLPHDFVGRYVVDAGDRRIKIAIDPHDNRKIASREMLAWSDVYFKSNRWAGEKYPGKVLPIVNGNGLHSRTSIEYLRTLRKVRKEYDFVFVSRIGAGVEHNLKLFEALAGLRGRTRIMAILYPQFGQDRYAPMLAALGVTCVTRNLPTRELWDLLARGRVNFLRLGAKYCIPWRMIDLLAMGSCIVVDREPFADWPVPLRDGVNFAACFSRADTSEELDYARVSTLVDDLIGDPARTATIAANNARYFDEVAAPARVAQYVIDSAAQLDSIDHGDLLYSAAVAPWSEPS
jgi:hypothetical protein